MESFSSQYWTGSQKGKSSLSVYTTNLCSDHFYSFPSILMEMTQMDLGWKSLCLNIMQPYNRNKPGETSHLFAKRKDISGPDLAPSEAQRRWHLWASHPRCLPAPVAAHGLAAKPTKIIPLSQFGGDLFDQVDWVMPSWVTAMALSSRWTFSNSYSTAVFISFLLCLIYLGWHHDTQLAFTLRMFSRLDIPV